MFFSLAILYQKVVSKCLKRTQCITCSLHNIQGFSLNVPRQLVIHLIMTLLLHNSSGARHRPRGLVVILAKSSQAKQKFPNMTEVKREQTK